MNHPEKRDGFPGQRIVVLPRSVIANARQEPLMSGLLPTDVGYFPRAAGHLRERSNGTDQAIFIFCTRGQGWGELAGQRHPVAPGELLVVPPGTPHVYGADRTRPWTIFWFHAEGILLNDYLRELEATPAHPVIAVGTDPQIAVLFDEVLEIVEHGYTRSQMLCASQTLAHLLAVMICRQREVAHRLPSAQQRISRTVAHMKQHLNQALPLDTLAAMANLSRSRYVELFKQQIGYAPIDYFIRLRMHRACQLLDTTSLSVKAIATELGYDDPLYFSRLFRAVNEMSPLAYRRWRKG